MHSVLPFMTNDFRGVQTTSNKTPYVCDVAPASGLDAEIGTGTERMQTLAVTGYGGCK